MGPPGWCLSVCLSGEGGSLHQAKAKAEAELLRALAARVCLGVGLELSLCLGLGLEEGAAYSCDVAGPVCRCWLLRPHCLPARPCTGVCV